MTCSRAPRAMCAVPLLHGAESRSSRPGWMRFRKSLASPQAVAVVLVMCLSLACPQRNIRLLESSRSPPKRRGRKDEAMRKATLLAVLGRSGPPLHVVPIRQFSFVFSIPNQERTGEGSDFLEFLRDDLPPWVENQYRTSPFRVLVGHFPGRLFAAIQKSGESLGEAPGTALDQHPIATQ